MLIKDLLSLEVPARQLKLISGLGVTPRTINKARRGIGDARERINWLGTVELSAEQLQALIDAERDHQQVLYTRRLDTAYENAMRVYTKNIDVEAATLLDLATMIRQFIRAAAAFRELQKRLDAVSGTVPASELVEPLRAMNALRLDVEQQQQKVIEGGEVYKQLVKDNKELRKEIATSQKHLKKKIPHKLAVLEKRVISTRTAAHKQLKEIENVESSNSETLDQAIQISDCGA